MSWKRGKGNSQRLHPRASRGGSASATPRPRPLPPAVPPRRSQPLPDVCVCRGGTAAPFSPLSEPGAARRGCPQPPAGSRGIPRGSEDPRGSGTHQCEQLPQAGRVARCAVPEPSVIGEMRGKYRINGINWFQGGGCGFGLVPRNSPRTGEPGGGQRTGPVGLVPCLTLNNSLSSGVFSLLHVVIGYICGLSRDLLMPAQNRGYSIEYFCAAIPFYLPSPCAFPVCSPHSPCPSHGEGYVRKQGATEHFG